MDVQDLNERGMETAIAQELEISMLCSSLISLNICPNLVLVSTVFQSEFGPPDCVWRNPVRNPFLLNGNKGEIMMLFFSLIRIVSSSLLFFNSNFLFFQ